MQSNVHAKEIAASERASKEREKRNVEARASTFVINNGPHAKGWGMQREIMKLECEHERYEYVGCVSP